MSVTISTAIDIHASRESIWRTLVDFATYGEWNPVMPRIEGRAEVGTELVVHLAGPRGPGTSFRPTVLTASPNQELRWLGRLGRGGIVDGEHFFVLTTNADGGTHLSHGETYSGALVALVKLLDRGGLERNHSGYDDFNQALKQRVEGLVT